MQEIEEIPGIEPVNLTIRPLVVDCIPSNSLVVEASASAEERAFWDAWLRKLDRSIVDGTSDPKAQRMAESEGGE